MLLSKSAITVDEQKDS